MTLIPESPDMTGYQSPTVNHTLNVTLAVGGETDATTTIQADTGQTQESSTDSAQISEDALALQSQEEESENSQVEEEWVAPAQMYSNQIQNKRRFNEKQAEGKAVKSNRGGQHSYLTTGITSGVNDILA